MHHNFANCCCSRKHGFVSFPKHVRYYLSDKFCNIQQRTEKTESLLHFFPIEKNHEVSKYDDPKETKSSAKKWSGYKVVLYYDLIVPCNKKDLGLRLVRSG